MWKRKLLLGALATVSIGVMPLTSFADTGIYVDIAPPAPRYEVVPAPRAGYVWIPGFWDYSSHRHHWTAGHWERERAGFSYTPSRWVEEHGKYRLDRGHWDHHVAMNDRHDRDHDGVPDREDRAPDNPYRH
jgi:hypothetical protein